MKAVRNEAEDNARNPAHNRRTGQRSTQTERGITAQRKREEYCDGVNSQRFEAQREEWKEQHRQPVAVLCERQRVSQRVEDICVEKVKRISEGLVVIPPQHPRHE